MHMTGFVTASEEHPCLILLFPEWVLSDAARFWIAVAGTVMAGILAEGLVAFRRWHMDSMSRSKSPRWFQKAQKIVLYAAGRTLGYLVMLVTMTFSVELFAAVILGLSLGHLLFNLETAVGADLTACCQAGSVPKQHAATRSSGNELTPCDVMSLEPAATMRRVQLLVQGLRCEACIATVRGAMMTVETVRLGEGPDLSSGVVEIYVPAESAHGDHVTQVLEALDSVGFSAKVTFTNL